MSLQPCRQMPVSERGGNALLVAFLVNYVVLGGLMGVIVSDVCGLPPWYDTRTHPPVTPDGRLQYVSEHIMRCKYSENAVWRAVPWATVYCFAVMLMQVLHTWVCLHKIEALQIARLQTAGAAPRVAVHAVFVGTMFATLAGYLLLVQFDHDYLPDVRDGDSAISDWMDLSKMHLAGVVMLVCGFFSLHMLVLHAYVMRVQSYHDFRHMCAGTGGSGCEWPALGRAGAAEAHLLPVLRRGVYVGCEAMYATMFVVFVVFFVFQVELVVVAEYLLLTVFVVVSIVNLTLGNRIWRVYGVV